MGYRRRGWMGPARQLFVAFETQTATVRSFVEHEFGCTCLPDPDFVNVADLVLSCRLPTAAGDRVVRGLGFNNPPRTRSHLRLLSTKAADPYAFAHLAVLACDDLRYEPDPDAALFNWVRFVESLDDPQEHFAQLSREHRLLEILLSLFARSEPLTEALIADPRILAHITARRHVDRLETFGELESDLMTQLAPLDGMAA